MKLKKSNLDKWVPRSGLAALLFAALAAHACAQSTFAFQGSYAGNGNAFTAMSSHSGATTQSTAFTDHKVFSGLDRQGVQQSMTFDGSAWSSSEYGRIHVAGQGTVTNSYYNSANPAYFDGTLNPGGSPDLLAMNGNAGWSDTFTYLGTQLSGYKVNYYFRLEGSVSGDTLAGLNFTTSDPSGASFNPRTTVGNELWITPWYNVVWNQPFAVTADFFAGMNTHVSQHPDGQTYTGIANYGNTLTLAGMTIVDPAGNLYTNWTMTSGSGTNYPIGAAPEPVALWPLGIGTCGLLLRRRIKRAQSA